MSGPRSQPPLCILGIGRSGTSLAASVASALGVDFGPLSSRPPSRIWNPKGFWEQLPITDLNDEVLAARGGTQIDPPPPDSNWAKSAEFAPFRSRVQEVVAELFGTSDHWGFKDPRTTLTLPLWQEALGELDYVICVRNPLEVVASVSELLPDGHDSFGLWAHYNCQALQLTAESRRLFVFHEDWFKDPAATAGRLAAFLHPDGGVSDEILHRAASIATPELHRSRASELELAGRDDVPLEVRAQHFLLRDLARAETEGDQRADALHVLVARLGDDYWAARR